MKPFNSNKYFQLQSNSIKDRIQKFSNGRLYLEIGGQMLHDGHAERVLPGFDPEVKVKIFRNLGLEFEIIFCVNADDILSNRLLHSNSKNYIEDVFDLLNKYELAFNIKPLISINKLERGEIDNRIQDFINTARKKGYRMYNRYKIPNYQNEPDTVTSENGFGFDEYIEVSKRLVIVSGAASNSGKLSTCLGQLYHESKQGLESGYAKYELFPIWNYPLNHPVNRAYEAATADIGDYNEKDSYHFDAYGIDSVNYNRDVEAFKILQDLALNFVSENNFIRQYKSPTDMGINMAGFCIEDDAEVRKAAILEIKRRRDEFQMLFDQGKGKKEWVERCEEIISQSKNL